MELISKRCLDCKYVGHYSGSGSRTGGLCCDYILEKGESRKCPAGDKCTKFAERKKKRRFKSLEFAK